MPSPRPAWLVAAVALILAQAWHLGTLPPPSSCEWHPDRRATTDRACLDSGHPQAAQALCDGITATPALYACAKSSATSPCCCSARWKAMHWCPRSIRSRSAKSLGPPPSFRPWRDNCGSAALKSGRPACRFVVVPCPGLRSTSAAVHRECPPLLSATCPGSPGLQGYGAAALTIPFAAHP
jgi:hypothetical protein